MPVRGAAEFALRRGVVPSLAEAVARPDASSEDGGDNAHLAWAEGASPEHSDDWFEENAALISRTRELLSDIVQRGALKKVGETWNRRCALPSGSKNSKGVDHEPVEAPEFQPRDSEGAFGGAPRGGASVEKRVQG